ncbi:MAG TPA: hypothetical protein VEI97_00890 [bacterium]|nr:hypothetical protein [bacterium]
MVLILTCCCCGGVVVYAVVAGTTAVARAVGQYSPLLEQALEEFIREMERAIEETDGAGDPAGEGEPVSGVPADISDPTFAAVMEAFTSGEDNRKITAWTQEHAGQISDLQSGDGTQFLITYVWDRGDGTRTEHRFTLDTEGFLLPLNEEAWALARELGLEYGRRGEQGGVGSGVE